VPPAPARQPTPRRRDAPAAPRPRPQVLAGGARGIRWDRVGRVALLVVMLGLALLYVGPSIAFVETLRESGTRKAEVQRLEREQQRLKARQRELKDPAALEREARRLGLVKPGERPFIVKGLPGD
jgi:cell division protein FtsB